MIKFAFIEKSSLLNQITETILPINLFFEKCKMRKHYSLLWLYQHLLNTNVCGFCSFKSRSMKLNVQQRVVSNQTLY